MNLLPLSALALTDHTMSSRKVNIDILTTTRKKNTQRKTPHFSQFY